MNVEESLRKSYKIVSCTRQTRLVILSNLGYQRSQIVLENAKRLKW